MSRLYGWKAFVITFLADASKGALAVVFARIVTGFMPFDAMWQFDLLIVLAVLFSIVGHVFCPWLGFKGGKGISTGFGSILVAYPFVALCLLATFLVIAGISKRISAGSICAATAFPFGHSFSMGVTSVAVVSVIIAIAVVFAHRSNIQRMINGEEPKFSFKSPARRPSWTKANWKTSSRKNCDEDRCGHRFGARGERPSRTSSPARTSR